MDEEDLFGYYLCNDSTTAENHITLRGYLSMYSNYAKPITAYIENVSRLFISFQLNYCDLREDYNEQCLCY
jgi:hypothetical protein